MTEKMVDSFADIRAQTVAKLLEVRNKGTKVVGIYCTFCPQELVIAAGAIPVGLCGTKDEPISAAEEVLPRNLCPLIKSSYGFAATDTCPFFSLSDLVVGETTCDGKKKMFEIMQNLKPVHVMQLPHLNKSGASLELWIEEIRKLRSRIEEDLGLEIKDEDIWKAIGLVNKEKKMLKEISDLNKNYPPVLSGLDLLTVVWSAGFSYDKAEIVEKLKTMKENLSKKENESATGPRIILTGCPVGLGSEKVIRITEELGAHVVALENCTGYKTLELLADTSHADPIVSLAQKYIQIPCSCMSPNPYRLDLLGRMLDEFNAEGLIDLTWQACHTYNIEAHDIKKLAEGKGLPYLQLETDYSSSDEESLKVRIESMLEMIDDDRGGNRPGFRCC